MSQPVVISLLPQTPANITQRGAALPASPDVRRPTFALYTLGCKVNQYDSHQIARALTQRGFRRVEFRECADLYVIDTCTVTAEADRKSRKAAGRARRNNTDAVVAVTGCAAAYAAEQFRRVAPDALVLDNSRKFELPELAVEALQQRQSWAENYAQLRDAQGSEPLPSPTRERAVLKIQDGCNHKCAFCIIPAVRGASQTKPRATILAEARAFVHEGARELVVTGVSMSDWGRDIIRSEAGSSGAESNASENGEEPRPRKRGRRNQELCSLLKAVSTIEGLERVRVSSLDPADVDDEFLETVAHTPKICPHIHLALQGGSAATLRRMRRRYTPEMFLKAAKRWREICPEGGLTTDIIVGFPGETAEDFEESLRIARESKFSAIHVFPYSPREGTVAADLPDHVAPAEQARRVDLLLALASDLSREYAEQFIGRELAILLEKPQKNHIEGITPHYVKAKLPVEDPSVYTAGDMVWFRAERWNDGALEGSLVERPLEDRNPNLYAGLIATTDSQ